MRSSPYLEPYQGSLLGSYPAPISLQYIPPPSHNHTLIAIAPGPTSHTHRCAALSEACAELRDLLEGDAREDEEELRACAAAYPWLCERARLHAAAAAALQVGLTRPILSLDLGPFLGPS